MVGARARLPLLLVLLVAVLYAGSFGNGFHFDDFHAVVLNPHILDLTRIPSFFYSAGAFSVNPESAMYRPLLLSTFAINYALSGATASGFHVVNVLLHGLAAAATLSWLRRVGFRPRVAGVAALLFAAVGSLLAKSVGVVAPFAMLLSDHAAGGWQRVRCAWRAYAVFGLLGIAYLLYVRSFAVHALFEAPVRPMATQLWTQVKAHVYYLQLIATPVRLNVEHQMDVTRSAESSAVMALLFLTALGGTAWRLRQQLGWTVFGGGLVGLVPAADDPDTTYRSGQ